MISRLHIRNFAIIDSLDLALDDGMSVLTGETGAGKSILIDALGLVLGERGSPESVRADCAKAEITAEFNVDANPQAQQWLDSASMRDEDDPLLCRIRRIVSRDGRGQQAINGSPCSVRELRELGAHLVEIHGQHANQTLTRRDAQRDILDGYAENQKALKVVHGLATDWQNIKQEIESLQNHAEDSSSRIDFLQFQIQELEQLNPQAGEVESLEAELRTLSHSGEIAEKGQMALQLLYDSDTGSAHNLLGNARRQLLDLARLDEAFGEIAATIESAEISAQEAASDLRDKLDQSDLDPQRLEAVNNRLAALHSLARKHRISDEELPELLNRLQQELDDLTHADQRIAELEKHLAQTVQNYNSAAEKLHKARSSASKKLSAAIQEHLQELGMPDAKMQIAVELAGNRAPSPVGADDIEFLISANPGQPPQPLSKVASGGELSRVSLAIQLESARLMGVPTMIFDEVDAGIGGGVAEMVGRNLAKLAADCQVLCVTHLPQVAAQAGAQYQVRKEVTDGKTYTRIEPLSAEKRIEEVARMLGGMEITAQTRAHAEEMISRKAS